MRSETARRILEKTPQRVKDRICKIAGIIVFKNKLLSLPCKNPRLRKRLKKI